MAFVGRGLVEGGNVKIIETPFSGGCLLNSEILAAGDTPGNPKAWAAVLI
jgi:hypothetical protein